MKLITKSRNLQIPLVTISILLGTGSLGLQAFNMIAGDKSLEIRSTALETVKREAVGQTCWQWSVEPLRVGQVMNMTPGTTSCIVNLTTAQYGYIGVKDNRMQVLYVFSNKNIQDQILKEKQ